MSGIEKWNSSSEWNLEQQKQEAKALLKELVSKWKYVLDQQLDKSDFLKPEEQEFINNLIKEWNIYWKEYLKNISIDNLSIYTLNMLVDNLDWEIIKNLLEIFKSKDWRIVAVKASREKNMLNTSTEQSLNSLANDVNHTNSNPEWQELNYAEQYSWNKWTLTSLTSPISSIESWHLNSSEKVINSLKSQKNRALSVIKESKNEIQLLINISKEYKWVDWISEMPDLLEKELIKLNNFEEQINNLSNNILNPDWKINSTYLKDQENLFSEINSKLNDTNNIILSQWDKLTSVVDFQKSTFLWWTKDVINWDIIDWLKQIWKTLLRLNSRLILSQEEYERDFHTRLWLYSLKWDTKINIDWVWVLHNLGKLNRWSAWLWDWVTHRWALENFLNHERWSQYLFLIWEEIAKEAWINKYLSSIIWTVFASWFMYMREKMSWALTPWDVTVPIMVDLWNWTKIELTWTIAWSWHMLLEVKDMGKYIDWANDYIKYLKFDWMINKWGWYKNWWMEEKSDRQLYDDHRLIFNLWLANGWDLNLVLNHNEVLSRTFSDSPVLYNFDSKSALYSQDIYNKKTDTYELWVKWHIWAGSSKRYNQEENIYWIAWATLSWKSKIWKIWDEDLTLWWSLTWSIAPDKNWSINPWYKWKLDLTYWNEKNYAKLFWELENNNNITKNWFSESGYRLWIEGKTGGVKMQAWVTNSVTWVSPTKDNPNLTEKDWTPWTWWPLSYANISLDF